MSIIYENFPQPARRRAGAWPYIALCIVLALSIIAGYVLVTNLTRVHNPYVVGYTVDADPQANGAATYHAFRCKAGLMTVMVRLDQTVFRRSSAFRLTDTNTSDDTGDQQTALVDIQLGKSWAVRAIVVQATSGIDDNDYVGPEDQTVLPEELLPGTRIGYQLDSSHYVKEQSRGDYISGVMLCIAPVKKPPTSARRASSTKEGALGAPSFLRTKDCPTICAL